jgi:serine/threonine-protein kinase
MVGQAVGKYRIVSRLGRGGMGTVYKAVDQTLDREVAIKLLNPDLADAELLKRFRAEAVMLARLNHPNIAMLFELTQHEEELLMVMEFVGGETLEALSQRSGPLPADRVREICSQVLDALACAHRAGIVHRDLKPANVMLTESGVIKVMDFGLARMAGTEHLTTDGFMVGTPAYMAPEQVLAGEIDGRADLYAMGVVLFRLLTAQLPFKADSGISMAHKQVHDAPTPVRQVRMELQPAYENIIGRALAKSPADRFQTAEEFKSALMKMSDVPLDARIAAPSVLPGAGPSTYKPAAATPVSAAVPAVPDPVTVMMRDAKRRKVPVAAAFVIGVLAFAGLPAAAYVVLHARTSSAALSPAARQDAPPSGSSQPSTSTPSISAPAPAPAPAASAAAAPATSTWAANPLLPAAARSAPAAPGGDAASRRGSPAPPPPARPSTTTVEFAQIRLLQLSNDKPRDHEVSVVLGAESLDVLDGSTLVQRARYSDVIGVFRSHSREPRWTKPDGTAAPVARVGGPFGFLKGASDWLTVQTRASFIPLHVTESELTRLVSELETRTGSKVVRTR